MSSTIRATGRSSCSARAPIPCGVRVSFALAANVENLTLTGAGKANGNRQYARQYPYGQRWGQYPHRRVRSRTPSTGGWRRRTGSTSTTSQRAMNGVANRDAIAGFSHAQHDRIDLATIDANQTAGHAGNQAFVFIGGQTFAAHAGSGEVRNGPGGVIQINVDAELRARDGDRRRTRTGCGRLRSLGSDPVHRPDDLAADFAVGESQMCHENSRLLVPAGPVARTRIMTRRPRARAGARSHSSMRAPVPIARPRRPPPEISE